MAPVSTSASAGIGRDLCISSNRTSFVFGLKGPSMTIDTACSAALVALDSGMRSVYTGGCSKLLVEGVNLHLTPDSLIHMSMAKMLSATGRSRTFDDSADGLG